MTATLAAEAAPEPSTRRRWPSVLVVHNRYQRRGGEDVAAEAEIALLRAHGARVETLFKESGDEAGLRRLRTRPHELVFNPRVYEEVRRLIREHGIEVVHCHNLFPLLSTSVYAAAEAEGAAIVQTVHNYRMGCLQALHLRDGKSCHACRPGWHAPAVRFGCYRGSRGQSLVFAVAQTINQLRGAWSQPTVFVAPSAAVRDRLAGWGVPAERIVVKPHFVPLDPGPPSTRREHAVFVGRLSPEKGVDLLLDAWGPARGELVIAGDGPQRAALEGRVREEGKRNVRFLGSQDAAGVAALLRRARFLVMPSQWHETFGLVLIEAYAHGVPVVATRLGAMAELVEEGVTGFLVEPHSSEDLGRALDEMERDEGARAAMGEAARRVYEARYSADAQAELLHGLYAGAVARGPRSKKVNE